MVTHYMITAPRKGCDGISRILHYIRTFDVHKWVIGAEIGASGYEHWQIRMGMRFDKVDEARVSFGIYWGDTNFHIEECSDNYEYECKEGTYIASWDTMEVRRQRFGCMRWYQMTTIERVRKSNDREIVVWYDPTGNVGKSWLAGHLYETGEAYYIPPYLKDVNSMIQTLASLAIEDKKRGLPPRPLVVIDIPRSWKWSEPLYTAIEAMKDGLIMEPRYSAKPINIRGIKVLVLTNTEPKLDKLSSDRWVIERTPMF